MKNRTHQWVWLLFIALLIPARSFSQTLHQNDNKPNIVFILTDDLGWRDLGIYGSSFYETPNIDRLASQGMRFMDAYASSPICSPSRSSIMTGQYPVRTGITDYIIGRQNMVGPEPNEKLIPKPFKLNLPKNEVTIAQALKQHGYATSFAGKWHLGLSPKTWPKKKGFDYNYGGWAAGNPRSYGMGGYFSPYHNPELKDGPKGQFLTDRLTTETIKFIKKEAKKGIPFFADLSFYAVHEPIQAKKKYIKKFKEKAHRMGLDTMRKFIHHTARMRGDADWRASWKKRIIQSNPVYAALIYSVDKNVGRILNVLKTLGISNNTVIVFTSDNGGLATSEGSPTGPPTTNYPLRYGKGFTYEGGTRIPLIIKWPGVVKSGVVNRFPVINTDFYPTFLQMAKAPLMPEQHKDGVSLVPLLKGKKSIKQPVLYWHYPHYSNQGGAPSSAIRQGDWKLIQFYGDNHVELYNLRDDTEEKIDLSARLPKKTATLLQLLDKWKANRKAKIPSINPYYNAIFFDKYVRTHSRAQVQSFLNKYHSSFSKKLLNPDLQKSILKRVKKLHDLTLLSH
jgi:arylsulfatase A-like enzyme